MRRIREVHGMSKTPIYQCWQNMISRTTPGHVQNGRNNYEGVLRDPKWDSFTGFYDDMGESYFTGAVLARVGDKGDYSPRNARWVTKADNARERAKHYTRDGRLGVDVARELGVPLGSYGNRIAEGYSVEEALGLEGRWSS